MIGVGGIMESQQSVSEGVVTTWEWACCGDGRTRVQLGGEFATDAPEELCGGGGGAQEEERPRRSAVVQRLRYVLCACGYHEFGDPRASSADDRAL